MKSYPSVPLSTFNRVAGGLAVVGLILFSFFRLTVPLGGIALPQLNQQLGASPLPSLTGFLWGVLIRLQPPFVSASAAWATGLSSLFGGLTLGLVFLLVSRWFIGSSSGKPPRPLRHGALIAASISGMYLMVSLPYWIAATGAFAMPFQTFLLLLPFVILWRPGQPPSIGRVALATFAYGLAVSESATAILYAPFFGILVLVQLTLGGRMKASSLLLAFGAGVLGLFPYLLSAWMYFIHPAYEWREFDHFGQILWYLWLEQYITLTATVPRHGWLTILVVSLVPLILVMTMGSPRSLASKMRPHWGSNILHAVLTALSIALLFDIPLTPWSLTKLRPLLITPYVLIAMWTGLLFGYWWLILHRTRGGTAIQGLSPRAVFAQVMVGLMLIGLIWKGVDSSRQSGRPVADLLNTYTQALVDSAEGTSWMISDSPLDEHIALAAHQRADSFTLIRASYAFSPVTMRYVASLFDEPRYQSLARIGLPALIEEWTRVDLDITDRLVTHQIPDIWLGANFEAVPDGLVYRGEHAGQALDIERLVGRHDQLMDLLGTPLLAERGQHGVFNPWIDAMLQHMSKNANNLGVLMDEREATDKAIELYRQSRLLVTNNISALMNHHSLAGRIEHPDFEALDQELTALVEGTARGWQSWALSRHYGFVRVPEAYVQRGMSWAMSGKPNLAISELKRAASITGEHTGLQLALGGLFFAEERDAESQESFQSVLSRDPDNQMALFGLSRLAARQGDYVGATALIERLRELGASPLALKLEESVVASLQNDPIRSMQLLDDVLAERPDHLPSWGALLLSANQANRPDVAARAIEQLKAAENLPPSLQLILAQQSMREREWVVARLRIDAVLAGNPSYVPALENAIRIDIAEGKREQAEQHVDRLLRQDPGNAFGNYVLGTLQYYAEQFTLAESSFRASLQTQRSPEALGDLAWLLVRRGALAEATPLVRESLELNPANSAAWDTLGVILTRTGRYNDANIAFQRALSYRPDSAEVSLHLAQLYEKQEQFSEALTIAEDLQTRAAELSTSAFNELRDLLSRLRAQRDS